MTPTPLAGCVLKLNRAQEHLKALEHHVGSFLNDDPHHVVTELDRQGRPTLRVKNLKDPPPEIAVLIGEFAYNARSALDHAAYDLTCLGSGTPPPISLAKSSAFPIFNSGPDYKDRQKNGHPSRKSGLFKVRGMPRGARATIERLQPYHRRNHPGARWLWVLEELSNVDKHRLLPVTTATLLGTSYTFSVTGGSISQNETETFRGPLKENAMIARLTVAVTPGAHVNVEANAVLDIIFDKASEAKSARSLRVMSALDAIMEHIAGEVMPALAGCFPRLRYGVVEGPPPGI
jgi:hypothetical protein